MSDQLGPDEEAAFADLERRLRTLEPSDLDDVAPPPMIWENIERALAAERLVGTSLGTSPDAPAPAPVAADAAAPVVPLRRRRPPLLAAAAAVLLLVIGAVTVRARQRTATVVASAALSWDSASFDPLGAKAVAEAQLVRIGRRYELRLVDAALPAAGSADLELWMISLDAAGSPDDIAPVSIVDAAHPGTYRVPGGIDPATHAVVDISIEPHDGDAKHSGRSILRGTLRPA